jgi:hypothetical protein
VAFLGIAGGVVSAALEPLEEVLLGCVERHLRNAEFHLISADRLARAGQPASSERARRFAESNLRIATEQQRQADVLRSARTRLP